MLLALLTSFSSCSREDEDVVKPVLSQDLPQFIMLDDEGGGETEDNDEMSLTLVLADRYDPSGEELGGGIVTLDKEFPINFQISELQGFDNISNYVLSATAFYDVDDCTSSEDESIVLLQQYDAATGRGSLIFPAGVEEIALVLTLDPDFFEDESLNPERGFSVAFSPAAESQEVLITETPFVYEVLDNEAIFGEWELSVDTELWENFQALFSAINEDIAALAADDIEEVVWDFKYDELSIEVVLKATETIEECGETEIENIVIELEGGYDELTRDVRSGEIALEGDIEQEDGSEEEFVYEGEFSIENNVMTVILKGEYQGEETEDFSLILNR